MKKKRNSVNVFAKDCIAMALIKLMKQKKYEDITITEIADTAGVSRVTYYRNYSSKEEIITYYMDELGYKLKEEISQHNPSGDIYTSALAFFQYWVNHSDFLTCLQKANLSYMLLEHMNKTISMFATTPRRKYEVCFHIGSMHNVMFEWVKGGMKESSEEMATILYNLYRNHLSRKQAIENHSE